MKPGEVGGAAGLDGESDPAPHLLGAGSPAELRWVRPWGPSAGDGLTALQPPGATPVSTCGRSILLFSGHSRGFLLVSVMLIPDCSPPELGGSRFVLF